jgi:Tfp pilus assembly protein PilV
MTHTDRSLGPRALRNQRGSTIIESLVALGLLAVTTSQVADFLVHQIRQASSNRLDTLAYSVAADVMESTRAQHFGEIATGTTTVDQDGVTFTVSTTVDNDTPDSGLKTITSQVSWNEPAGSRAISVSAIYTDIGGTSDVSGTTDTQGT